MSLVRFSAACLLALTCLGTSYALAGGPITGKPGKLSGARLTVTICAGDVRPGLCGPKAFARGQLSTSFPAIARQAGTISAAGPMNVRCPGVCESSSARAVQVTIRAWPRRDGYHEFDHWEGACMGTVPTCTVRVQGDVTVKAVFRSDT